MQAKGFLLPLLLLILACREQTATALETTKAVLSKKRTSRLWRNRIEGNRRSKSVVGSLRVCFMLPFLCLNLTVVAMAQSPRVIEWKAKYEMGNHSIKKGTKLVASIDQQKVTFKRKNQTIFEIPAGNIQKVVYDNTLHSRAVWWAKSGLWFDTSWGPYPGVNLLASGIALGLGSAVLAPFHSKKHFIHVFWSERTVPKAAALEFGKGDYFSFLQSLQAMTGAQWRNLPAEREWLRRDLEQQKHNKVPILLQHDVQTTSGRLKSGLYQLILLSREEDPAELYFFKGKKVKTNKIKAVESVTIVPNRNEIQGPEVVYRKEGGLFRIHLIRVREATYIVRPSPDSPAPKEVGQTQRGSKENPQISGGVEGERIRNVFGDCQGGLS